MDILIDIFAFLFAIFILVLVHEFGHYWTAKRLGIKVQRFSIGFGKPFFRWRRKGGTEFVLAPIPLGGYVKLLDEREEPVPKRERHLAFNRQPAWKRIIVILAGVVTNVLLAIVAFWLMFVIGLKVPKPIIGAVTPQSFAAQAGLRAGDEILSVNGRDVKGWQGVILSVLSRIGENGQLRVKVERKGIISTHQIALANWRIDELQPEPVRSLGIEPYRPHILPVIHEIEKGSPAAKAGLEPGDHILAVGKVRITDWHDFVEEISSHPKKRLMLTLQRGGRVMQVPITVGKRFGPRWKRVGYIGVRPIPTPWPETKLRTQKYSIFAAWPEAWDQTWSFLAFNGIVLGKLITGKMSLHALGGPIAIFQVAEQAFRQGVAVYIGFLAFISVMLAFVNVLPIPGLDGGHLLLLLIEQGIRRPLSNATHLLVFRLGLIFLLVIVAHATINDLLRMFGG